MDSDQEKTVLNAVFKLQELVQDLDQRVKLLEQKKEEAETNRNKSSPTLKDMTTADARRVLNGDCADLPHKEAAEKLGLTYAQVYSCRYYYTFKEVHRTLESEGWRNTKWQRR